MQCTHVYAHFSEYVGFCSEFGWLYDFVTDRITYELVVDVTKLRKCTSVKWGVFFVQKNPGIDRLGGLYTWQDACVEYCVLVVISISNSSR